MGGEGRPQRDDQRKNGGDELLGIWSPAGIHEGAAHLLLDFLPSRWPTLSLSLLPLLLYSGAHLSFSYIISTCRAYNTAH